MIKKISNSFMGEYTIGMTVGYNDASCNRISRSIVSSKKAKGGFIQEETS